MELPLYAPDTILKCFHALTYLIITTNVGAVTVILVFKGGNGGTGGLISLPKVRQLVNELGFSPKCVHFGVCARSHYAMVRRRKGLR